MHRQPSFAASNVSNSIPQSSFAAWSGVGLYLHLQSNLRGAGKRNGVNLTFASADHNQIDDMQRRLRDELQELLKRAHELNMNATTAKTMSSATSKAHGV